MKLLQAMMRGHLLGAAALGALGLLFLLWPQGSALLFCRVVGVVLLLGAVVRILVRLRNPAASWTARLDVICSLLGVLLGAMLLLWPQLLVSLLHFLVGLYILVQSAFSLRGALHMHRSGMRRGAWAMGVLAAVGVVIGLLIVINPFQSAVTLVVFIGLTLLFCALQNLLLALHLLRTTRAGTNHVLFH